MARKRKQNPYKFLFLLLLLLGGIYLIGDNVGWWAAEATSSQNSWTIYAHNGTAVMDGENGRHEINASIYMIEIEDHISEIEDWTQEDYDELDLSTALVLDKSGLEHGDTYEPKFSVNAEAYYFLLVESDDGNGYTEYQTMLRHPSTYPDGVVSVNMIEQPDDALIIGFNSDGYTNLTSTTSTSWFVSLNMLDSDNKVDENIGYATYVDYQNCDALGDIEEFVMYNVFTITFNSSTNVNRSIITNFESDFSPVEKVVDGASIEYYFDQNFVGSINFQFDIESGVFGHGGSLGLTSFSFGQSYIDGSSSTTIATYS